MIQVLNTTTHSENETYELAKSLAHRLEKGAIIILKGGMGVGKSVFARGIIQALEYSGAVTSPTFTLMNEYPTNPPVYHFDMYRLEYPEQLYDIGYDEYIYSNGISLIEWSERMEHLHPDEYILVEIERISESDRQISISTNCTHMTTK